MKKNIMNKQIIKAIAIGISASMALQPVAALAADNDDINLDPAKASDDDNSISEKEAQESFDTAIDTVVEDAANVQNEVAAANTADQAEPAVEAVVGGTNEIITPAQAAVDQVVTDAEKKAIADDAASLASQLDEVNNDDAPALADDVQKLDEKKTAIDTAEGAVDEKAAEISTIVEEVTQNVEAINEEVSQINEKANGASTYDDIDNINKEIENAQQKVEVATTDFNSAKDDYDNKKSEYDAAVQNLKDKEAAYNAALSGTQDDIDAAKADLDAAKVIADRLAAETKKAHDDAVAKKQAVEAAVVQAATTAASEAAQEAQNKQNEADAAAKLAEIAGSLSSK